MSRPGTADTVWIPAVPLPFLFLGRDQCGECGERFWGRRDSRRHRYEVHYRRVHEASGDLAETEGVLMEVTRVEAQRIYAEVNADSDSPPEREQP